MFHERPTWHQRRPLAAGGAALGALLLLALALGPRARVATLTVPLPALPAEPAALDAWLAAREAAIPGLIAGREKTIEWHGARGARTPYAVVYLHGFSADRHEIDPVPERVATLLGANRFHTRLTGHAMQPTGMGVARAEEWLEDAAEAVAVGQAIGERVVLIGTSTGGTLALWAAAQPWAGRIDALVLLAPNLGPADPAARMLLWPWGHLLLRVVAGEERCFEPHNAAQARHWTTCYPSRALLPMMALVQHVRGLPLESIAAPALMVHSPADQVVSTEQAAAAFTRLGSRRRARVLFDATTDPAGHVLAGDILSPASNDTLVAIILRFLDGPARGAAGTVP